MRFFLLLGFLVLSVLSLECITKTSENKDSIYLAFRNASSCDKIVIIVDREATFNGGISMIQGSFNELKIFSVGGPHRVHLPLILFDFDEVEIEGLEWTGILGSPALDLEATKVQVRNCSFYSNSNGGISVTNTISTVEDCRFYNNTALIGGAIHSESPLVVRNSIFTGNIVSPVQDGRRAAGAIYSPEAHLYNSVFTENSASVLGGAVYAGTNLTVHNCSFVDNVASIYYGDASSSGGAIRGSSFLLVEDSRFEGNRLGSGEGGAIHNDYETYIYRSTFINNSASRGGAISIQGYSDTILEGCTFEGNFGKDLGGAIYGETLIRMSLKNIVAFNNSAGIGGFLYTLDVYQTRYFTASNLMITDNSATIGSGGGIRFGDAYVTIEITNSTFERNTAAFDGGAISVAASIKSPLVTFQNITSNNNSAVNNGGFASLSNNLANVVLTGIFANGDTAKGNGGCIVILNSNSNTIVRIEDVSISNSVSSLGAAVYIAGLVHVTSISGSTFFNNSASEFSGGAVAMRLVAQQIQIVESKFIENQARSQGSALIFQDTSEIQLVVMVLCKFQRNVALDGAAVSFRGSIDTIISELNKFEGNEGTLGSSIAFSGNTRLGFLFQDEYKQNVGERGGAIYVQPRNTNMILSMNSTIFEENLSSSQGGALFLTGAVSAVLFNDTFVNNVAAKGGACYFEQSSQYIPRMLDCSFHNNEASESGGAVSININKVDSASAVVSEGCRFERNKADSGGAVSIKISSSSIKRSVSMIELNDNEFINNNASTNGGDLDILGDVTLNGNSFESQLLGSGISVQNGTLTIFNNSLGSSSIFLSPSGFILSDTDITSSITCPSYQHAEGRNETYTCVNTTIIPVNSSANIIYVEHGGGGSVDIRLIIGISVGVGGFLLIVIVIASVLLYRRQKRARLQANSFSMIDFTKINLGEAKKSLINFDDIKMIKEIGAGAFGVVYQATWREVAVAVKQIKSENVTEVQLQDFLQEVAILKGIRTHPNVVLFLGITFPPQPLSLITEFCEGGSLYDHLRKNLVNNKTKHEFILGIAKGMLHLHHEHVIHRDLAVRNILLSKHLEPKVADFGLSREHSDSDSAATTATSVGPLKWMAPEALLRREYGIKSDVFSFGVVVWEILTVEEPWSGLSPVEAAIKVTNEGARLDISENVHPMLRKVMQQCWEHSPEDRPNFSQIIAFLDPQSKEEMQALDSPSVSVENSSHYEKWDLKGEQYSGLLNAHAE